MAQLFPSETRWWRNVPKGKLQNKIKVRKSKSTYDQSRQCHLGTIVPVSLMTNHASVTWKQSCQCHLWPIVPVSLGNNRASTYHQSRQCHLGTIMSVSFAVDKKKRTKNWYFEFFPVELLENFKFFSYLIILLFITESLLKFYNLRKFYNE